MSENADGCDSVGNHFPNRLDEEVKALPRGKKAESCCMVYLRAEARTLQKKRTSGPEGLITRISHGTAEAVPFVLTLFRSLASRSFFVRCGIPSILILLLRPTRMLMWTPEKKERA